MKNLGYLTLAVGFLFGAWVSSQHETEVDWLPWIVSVIVATVGVVIARNATRSEARAGDKMAGNMADLRESIDRVARNIASLDDEKTSINPYDLHARIDEAFAEDLATFADARETIAHMHGLQEYAEVMNEFAAGERYLNRVWSASVDGYIDECNTYLGRARAQFEKTRDCIHRLGGGAA